MRLLLTLRMLRIKLTAQVQTVDIKESLEDSMKHDIVKTEYVEKDQKETLLILKICVDMERTLGEKLKLSIFLKKHLKKE